MAFNDYDFSLSANGTQQIAVMGSTVRVRSCTGSIKVSVDGGPGVTLSAGQGFKLDGGAKKFRDLTVKDMSGAANAGVIFVGDGEFLDSTLFGSISLAGGVSTVQTAGTVGTVAGALFGARPGRKYLLIQNNGTDTIYVRIDGGAVTTANGFKINPGGYLEINGNAPAAAINAISGTAGQAVIVAEGW